MTFNKYKVSFCVCVYVWQRSPYFLRSTLGVGIYTDTYALHMHIFIHLYFLKTYLTYYKSCFVYI